MISLNALNLLSLSQTEGVLDTIVVTGKEKNIKVRIVVVPVPEEVTDIRRMKARKEAKKRGCSYESLQLLGWTIFLTTLEDPSFTIHDACKLYALRWRIECIFKTGKNDFNFEKIHNIAELHLRVLRHACFIIIILAYQLLYKPIELRISQSFGKQLSLLKCMRFISRCLKTLVSQFVNMATRNRALQKVARYCC